MANEKANKVTFEQEAKIYEEKALAEIKKISGNGSAEPPEIACILQSGRRAIYMARQELASRVEVVHGRWLSAYEYSIKLGVTDKEKLEDAKKDKWWKFCNDCEQAVKGFHNYCPNCGADMRERKCNG